MCPTIGKCLGSVRMFPWCAHYFLAESANWKKRKGDLIAVDVTFKNAYNYIKRNARNDIISVLRARLRDGNHNSAAVAFDVVEKFARGMGPGGMIHFKLWIYDIFSQGLIDNKTNAREGSYRFLDILYEQHGLTVLIKNSPLPLGSKHLLRVRTFRSGWLPVSKLELETLTRQKRTYQP